MSKLEDDDSDDGRVFSTQENVEKRERRQRLHLLMIYVLYISKRKLDVSHRAIEGGEEIRRFLS